MSAPSPPPRIDPLLAARTGVLDLDPYIPGKPIHEVQQAYGLREVIKLASNECPLPLPDRVLQAIARSADRLCRYPDGHCGELRRRLAPRLGVPPECLLFGNGAEECIRLIAQAFLNPADHALVPAPSFDAYATATRLAGAEVERVPLQAFRIDLEAILARVTPRTKIIWLCSPNNPTGTLIRRAEFSRFLERLPDNRVVVLDEAYREYVGDPEGAAAREHLFSDGRVIGIRTFSKAFGLAGLRLGYLVAHPALVRLVAQVKLPFNVSVPAQAAALQALEETEFLEAHVRMIRQERAFLEAALVERGGVVVPSEANFLFARMPLDGNQLFRKLLPLGIIIRPGAVFGLPDFIRLSVGTREQNLRCLAALDQVLSGD